MSIYRYNTDSKIDEIVVRTSAGSGVRMFLHANENASADDLTAVKSALSKKGWLFVATLHGGKNTLEIRVPRKVEQVEEVLRGISALSGKAAVIQDEKKPSLKEKFKNNLMSIYGWLSFAGDIGLLRYEVLKARLPDHKPGALEGTASTIAYGAGSLAFLGLGRGDKSNYQLADMCKKLNVILRREGLSTDDCAINTYTDSHGRSFWKKLYHKMQAHPAEIGNTFTGTAGALILTDAIRHKHGRTGKERLGDGALGLATALSGYGTVVIHEKKRDPSAPKPTGFAAVKAWIQETPNRLAGYGYMISTLAHAAMASISLSKIKTTYSDYEMANNNEFKNPKNYTPEEVRKFALIAHSLRLGFALINIVGEFVLAKASKGHGHGVKSDHSLEDSVYAVVADAIIRQPEEKREHLIKELAHAFIGAPEGLNINPDEAEKALRNRVENALKNPWAGLKTQPTAVANEPDVTSTVWQKRVLPQADSLQSAMTPA